MCEELTIRTGNLVHLFGLVHCIPSRCIQPPNHHQQETPRCDEANGNQKWAKPDNQMSQKFKEHMLKIKQIELGSLG